MDKQNKVLTSINRTVTQGRECGQLQDARRNPNDECYTSITDIMTELSFWAERDKFRGKRIICPCDWDIVDDEEIYSITIEYKDDNIDVTSNNVYKSVQTVTYNLWEEDLATKQLTIVTKTLADNEIEYFLRNRLTCNFIRALTQNARRWGIKSITASGYNPANNKGIPFQEVNYKSYDICITNPPFSLYKDFMKCVVGNIDFIILAPYLNRVNPCIGLYLMTTQAYLGVGRELDLEFSNPTPANQYHTKHVACDWIVSWSDAQDEVNNQHYSTNVDYETYKSEYTEMTGMTMKDGTHPILVGRRSYPCDYDGWMFGSVGILNQLDQSTYEWYGTAFHKYFNRTNREDNPFNHELTNEMVKNPTTGKGFHEIVFRKKQ